MIGQFVLFLKLLRAEIGPFLLVMLILTSASTLLFSSYSVFSGLHHDFFQQIQEHRPHLIIRAKEGFLSKQEADSIAHKNIREFASVLVSQGMLSVADKFFCGVLIHGREKAIPDQQIRLSEGLAAELNLHIGDLITLVVADGSHHDLTLHGLFPDYGFPDTRQTVEINLRFAQEIIIGENSVNQLEVKLYNLEKTADTALEIAKAQSNIQIETWENIYAETIKLFHVEKMLHFAIFMLMLIFCFFSIHCAFLLLFLRREKSLTMLLKFGLSARRMRLFLLLTIHGLVFMCLLVSSLLSFLVKKYLQAYPIELPTSLFYSANLPFFWDWYFWAFVAIFIYFAAILAFILPSRKIIGHQ